MQGYSKSLDPDPYSDVKLDPNPYLNDYVFETLAVSESQTCFEGPNLLHTPWWPHDLHYQ